MSRYRIRRTSKDGTVAVVRTIHSAMTGFCCPVNLRTQSVSALGGKAETRSLLLFRPLHLSSTLASTIFQVSSLKLCYRLLER